MRRWIGFLASWSLLVLGVAVSSIAFAAETINVREDRRFRRFEMIDKLIAAKTGGTLEGLRAGAEKKQAGITAVTAKLAEVDETLHDFEDTDQTILVSTSENRVRVRRGGEIVFDAVCSTGKGTTLVDGGRTRVFSTPAGKFKIVSKEENPVWVPPDWHYVEEARKNGMKVVHLDRGDTIDAATGGAGAPPRDTGVWSWLGDSSGGTSSNRVLKVKGDSVVEVANGVERELPPGEIIRAGNTIVIPPIGVKQRKFDKVLGSFRLNLGDGYALHGTQQTSQLGQSVSHGCVRLGDTDIETLYRMANVGDEVIMY